MKRIVYFIMIFAACLMLICPMTISAEEVETDEAFVIENSENVPVSEPAEEEAEPNIFTRLYEAFYNNRGEVFTLGGSAALLVLSLILKKDLGASSKTIVNGISSVISKSDLSSERQEAIVGGLNEMIDGYEEIKGQTEYVKNKIEEFESAVERVESSNSAVDTKLTEMFTILTELIVKEMRQNTELMEVLSTVYTNNEVVPHGVKEFVSLMRTENVKLLQEASQLTSNTVATEGGEAV